MNELNMILLIFYCLFLLFNSSLCWKLVGKKVINEIGAIAYVNASLMTLDNEHKV